MAKKKVFPSHQLLDHIPELLKEIAAYLRAPAEQEIAANTGVMTKAAELGLLRFDQCASVHQVLREYQILGEILEAFFARQRCSAGGPMRRQRSWSSAARSRPCASSSRKPWTRSSPYTETIERQTAQLRNFSRLVSHEIRQPLGVLQVLARVLPVREGQDESARLVETLERNVVRLAEVAGKLERLHRLTRPSENAPNEQRVELSSVVNDVTRQLRDMADVRGVVFEVDRHLPTFAGDAGRVELVVMNLLANAVKYSDPAKPSRVVSVEHDASIAHPCVRIRDNGIGIPKSKLEKIFDQFVRVHAHLDDELGAQGLGLGLSIVRESMDAMGATVTVESAEGQGTTFVLEWPSVRHRERPPT